MSLKVKIADQPGEFEQIFRLNYRTFVEEIPQHDRNPERMLIDRFHADNLYLICVEAGELLGMVALRDRRPFSLDSKLTDLDSHIPENAKAIEVRLLAVRPERRHGPVFGMLMKMLFARCLEMDYDVGLISGRLENIPLYEKLGFRPFGPRVGGQGAWYQPMRIDKATLNRGLAVHPRPAAAAERAEANLNFLPGPVAHTDKVRKALALPAESHRSWEYASRLQRVKNMLLQTTRAGGVEILIGTGTLANDVVAAQLSLRPGSGLILSNGEFGERLIRHAEGFRLKHAAYRLDWGAPFDMDAVGDALRAHPDAAWVWAVHCETSTGRINPIGDLLDTCGRHRVSLCLDCISSLGTIPLDLSGVDLASGVSGKGVGAFTGLSLVFYGTVPGAAPSKLPRCLDLGLYAAEGGMPFSGSSNLLSALETSLLEKSGGAFPQRLQADSRWLRERLSLAGIPVLIDAAAGSPAVLTLPLPEGASSVETGTLLEDKGILIGYQSEYLVARNWIQVCLMADHARSDLETLVSELRRILGPRPDPAKPESTSRQEAG